MKTNTLFLPHAVMLAATLVAAGGCLHRRPRQERPPTIAASFNPAPARVALGSAWLQPTAQAYRLGPGDVLEIEVLGDVNTRSTTIVGPDGKIYFYLLPGIDVWGLTLSAARDRVVQELQRLIREQQPVGLTLRKSESQRVWLLGELNQPGIYTLAGPTTLLEALAQAGGVDATPAIEGTRGSVLAEAQKEGPDLSRAFIIRDGHVLRVDFNRLLREGDLSQNIYLQPHDFVYVPPTYRGAVHVLGAVESPRAVSYPSQLTLAQAIAAAGGPRQHHAQLSKVAIVRGSLSQPRLAMIDYSPIVAGQASDIALQPQDIIYVPSTSTPLLDNYVDMILDDYARTIGVSEGVKAADERTQLGGPVPIGRK